MGRKRGDLGRFKRKLGMEGEMMGKIGPRGGENEVTREEG